MRRLAVQAIVVLALGVLMGASASGASVSVSAAEHERVMLSRTASGELELRGPFGTRTSRRGPGFDQRLADAARGARLVVTVQGGGTLEVGSLSSRGALALEAERVTVTGAVAAPSVRLVASDTIYVESAAAIDARTVELEGRVVMNIGAVAAGRISISGDRVMNQGPLSARVVSIAFARNYLESRRGSIDASSGAGGGTIAVIGGEGSYLFSSGRHRAGGPRGGDIRITAGEVKLVGASLDASGSEGGGRIAIGDKTRATERVAVQGNTTLDADAQEAGPGGRILLASADRTVFTGRASARGGAFAGDGGFVDVSSAGDVGFAGEVTAASEHGRAGRVLVDPKNITIDEPGVLAQQQLVDPSPSPGDQFGSLVLSLSTGNVVVTDRFDDFAATNAGAVHLFAAIDGALITTLTGSTANDQVGIAATALTNGNYVVSSTVWDNGGAVDAGAATLGDGATGVAGAVSAANSLVGTTANDQVGSGVTVVTSGNYVVSSPTWDNVGVVNAGAATWGNGTTGIAGAISAANSLVGTTANDQVGSGGVTALTNGNYVVSSISWDNAGVVNAGAATWGNGTAGVSGAVSAANSLVGTTANDQVGASGLAALTNGNNVVLSRNWDNGAVADAGAATWANGTTGIFGAVTAANSLVGATASNSVGGGATALTNGNYVVTSPNWDNGVAADAGAATWGNGATGISGASEPSQQPRRHDGERLCWCTRRDRAHQRKLRGQQPQLGQWPRDRRGRSDLV